MHHFVENLNQQSLLYQFMTFFEVAKYHSARIYERGIKWAYLKNLKKRVRKKR